MIDPNEIFTKKMTGGVQRLGSTVIAGTGIAGNWDRVVEACKDESVYELVVEGGCTNDLAGVLLKMQKNTNVQSIVINNCRLRAADVSALEELLPQLSEIRLQGNDIKAAPRTLLESIFQSGTHLQTLKLPHINLRGVFPKLAKMLVSTPLMNILDLSWTNLKTSQMIDLCGVLTHDCRVLKDLSIAHNLVARDELEEWLKAMELYVTESEHLNHLDISGLQLLRMVCVRPI